MNIPESEMTDEQISAIESSWPRCPTCQELPVRITFTYHAIHKLDISIDGSANLEDSARTLIYDTEYDILDKEPELLFMIGSGVPKHGIPLVECEHGHSWREPRLRRRSYPATDSWELLPQTIDTQVQQLELLRAEHMAEFGPIQRTYGDSD